MNATIGISTIIGIYIVVMFYNFHSPTKGFVDRIIKKFPKLVLLFGIVIVVIIYSTLTYKNESVDYKNRPQDCEYDAYHGWTCN